MACPDLLIGSCQAGVEAAGALGCFGAGGARVVSPAHPYARHSAAGREWFHHDQKSTTPSSPPTTTTTTTTTARVRGPSALS